MFVQVYGIKAQIFYLEMFVPVELYRRDVSGRLFILLGLIFLNDFPYAIAISIYKDNKYGISESWTEINDKYIVYDYSTH